MLKFVAIAVLVTFFVHSPGILSATPEIRLLSDQRKELAPGATANILLSITNTSDTIREFELKFNKQNNWRQIMNYSSILIEGNTSVTKIISIKVPENAKAGDYTIHWDAIEKPGSDVVGKVSIPIRVISRYQLEVVKQKVPGYMYSGDTLGVQFSIRNLSNTDVSVTTTTINGQYPETHYLNIPKDSTIIRKVTVHTAKHLDSFSHQSVTLSAMVTGKPETHSTGTYWFDILPSEEAGFDGYNRLPVKIAGIFASGNRLNKRYYAFMYDIRGGGFLREEDSHRLDFHFRGPDRSGNPILGMNDEYNMSYRTKKAEFYAGDHNFSLSDLTESSRIGRGIKLAYKLNNFSVGSFFHSPRYYPGTKNSLSIYTNWNRNENFRLAAGYLAKTDTLHNTANLFTLSGTLRPFLWMHSSFEVAMGILKGNTTRAYSGIMNINHSFLSSHLNIKYAEPNFPGYLTNSLIVSSGVKINLKKFTLSANYDHNSSNLALDTLYANAPFSKNMFFTTFFRISPDNSLGISINSVLLKDRGVKQLFDYTKYFGRFFLENKIRRFNFNIYGDYGKIINYLAINETKATDFYTGNLQLRYILNETFSMKGFINYEGGSQYQVTGHNRYYYGGSLLVNLKKTFLSFDYQSDYELKEYFRDRSLLTLQLHHQLHPNHEVELSTNYRLVKNSVSNKEFSIQARYVYTLNLPVSKKRNNGSLHGKVTTQDTLSTEGILFTIGGKKAMTNKNGEFRFPVLKAGTYEMTMDESKFELNTIATVPGPYRITIEAGKIKSFESELTKAARIAGKLIIKEDKSTTNTGFYPVKEEIDKLIVEASGNNETFRVYTGSDGTFSFNDLRPGDWNIKIYPNGIPDGYKIEKDQFTFRLTSGKTEQLEVVVHKKNREIKLQATFKK
jgi:hypothetical protein